MEEIKYTFERMEKKFFLTPSQYGELLERLGGRIEPDEYYKSQVCNIYYDTANHELIRRSIDGPIYKEKLRLRSYKVPDEDDTVFVEIKKKYKGITYKRRSTMSLCEAREFLSGGAMPEDSQINREIAYFVDFYKPVPSVFLAYDRESFIMRGEDNMRITFDTALRWRDTDLDLSLGGQGTPMFDDGRVLMEIKLKNTVPFWLARLLSDVGLRSVNYSKYGAYYKSSLTEKCYNGVIIGV